MEKVKVRTVNGETTVSHKLEKNEHLNAVELDIMEKNEIPALCPVWIQRSLGGETLVYRLGDYTSLSAYFARGVRFGRFAEIVMELAGTIFACDLHGIRSSNLELRGDYIYIDERDGRLHLLYWPILALDEYPDIRRSFLEMGLNYAAPSEDVVFAQKYVELFDTRFRFNIIQFQKSVEALLDQWRLEQGAGSAGKPGAAGYAIVERATGKRTAISKTPFTVGRLGQFSDLAFPDDKIMSRSHFTLEVRGGSVYVTDNGSTNGTRVNGRPLGPVGGSVVLHDGDVIEAGGTAFVFSMR